MNEQQELFWKILRTTTLVDQVRISQMRGEPTTQLLKTMVDIATTLSISPTFVNFSYREDMKNEAIVVMLRAWNKIDLEKCEDGSVSVFRYLATAAQDTFMRSMHDENRWNQIKEEALARLSND